MLAPPLRRWLTTGLTTGISAVVPVFQASPAAAVPNPAGFVNTLIGTSNSGETWPGADTPFGMVQWSPENTRGNQTRTVQPGGYGYDATRIRGFSLTHLSGTGCAGASGDIPFVRTQYANLSGWDVYRGQLQLVTLLRPDVGGDIAQSLLNQANPEQRRVGPVDAQPGRHARDDRRPRACGAAEHLRVRRTELRRLRRACLDGAVRDHSHRRQREFLTRGQYWKNVFNPGNGGFIQNRNENGSWPSFNPSSSSGFAEGSAAQYTWMVTHNVRGLFDRMGGNAAVINRLNSFFHNSDGSWALTNAGGLKSELDNEPSIWVPWLYNFAGAPFRTQETVREVVNRLWTNTPGGIPGQDDLGAMSAWYVWAAMGMHPLMPGRAELLLASPLFPQIVVRRSNGVTLTVSAPGASANVKYVQNLTVNGTSSNRSWLPESFVTNGGTLAYALGANPNTSWGSSATDAPPSFDG